MTWKEQSRVDERMRLVGEYLKGERSMVAICDDYGVSSKTAYKWIGRYQQEGPAGLLDRSRAPHHHPNRVDATVVEALIMARRAHPYWGARKIVAWLSRSHPELELPVPSTVAALFARCGLSRSRRARRVTPPFTEPFADIDAANRVWCADFKGDFRTGDGRHCYPLTITDAYSRTLLRCTSLRSTKTDPSWKVFEAAFRQYGLPDRVRTDNGSPFASRGAGGLSRLSVWWVKLGICHERIEPGHPEQNGRHERMHRTLKQETLRPPAGSMRAQQKRFDRFLLEYNDERPHEALDNATPSSLYCASSRPYPRKLGQVQYPDRFVTRKLSQSGRMRWDGRLVTIGRALRGEWIGFDEKDGTHHVYFGDVLLGFIDSRRPELGVIRPPVSSWARSTPVTVTSQKRRPRSGRSHQ